MFWELFSGAGVLTSAFMDKGWWAGPPVDWALHPAMDLTNAGFVTIVLGIILEGRVSVLHCGPPCSTFSMAMNRFPSKRIRSSMFPAGLPGLPPAQQEKVDYGNYMAELTLKFVDAQASTGNWFTVEQPATSLMLLLPGFVQLISQPDIFLATRAVCNDGAPWEKRTSIISNFAGIMGLDLPCQGGHTHIRLEGKDAEGRAWTSVACS